MPHRTLAPLALILSTMLPAMTARADDGDPVAVRWWGQGYVTIETMWDLRIAIDPYSLRIGYDDPGIRAHVVLVTHEHGDHNNVAIVAGEPEIVRGLDDAGDCRALSLVLDRPANAPAPVLAPLSDAGAPSPNAVRIRTVASDHDDRGGAERGHNAIFVIEVDGVRIVHCGDLGQSRLSQEQRDAIASADVLLMPAGGVYTMDGAEAAKLVETLGPRIVIPIHYKTDVLTIDLESERAFVDALPSRFERVAAQGNTIAISKASPVESYQPRVVTLDYRPWTPPAELDRLLREKEDRARAAAAVFAELAVNQMNHRPSNGTHTPRWNVEHMAGTELLFFSRIYAGIDPSVGELDRSPAQMPADYTPAHPDWTGAEEARRIERVQHFTRRFAYLLAGAPLDERPEGAPPFADSLRGLLELMARHWTEHTANVQAKFSLSDWPEPAPE